MQEALGYCLRCDKKVRVRRAGMGERVNFFLTLATLGLWLWIWVLITIVTRWRCSECEGRAACIDANEYDYLRGAVLLFYLLPWVIWSIYQLGWRLLGH